MSSKHPDMANKKKILHIVKIGGNIIDDEVKLSLFLSKFSLIAGEKILVHGGGKLATRMAEKMEIPQQLVEGRRITDAETLKIVTMVYAGLINKTIVAQLQAHQIQAVGITGADGNSILAHQRQHSSIDYGFAGDIDRINSAFIKSLLDQQTAIVFAPITHNGKGQLLNTNADTIAQELAKALSEQYEVCLIYSFEKAGVLLDTNDETTVIGNLSATYYWQLKSEQKIFSGMLPKLDNAFAALNNGVSKVIIGKAEELELLIAGTAGTTISHEQ